MLPIQVIQVALISSHPLWLQTFRQVLEGLTRKVVVIPVNTDAGLGDTLTKALESQPDVVMVSLDIPFGGLNFTRALRESGYTGGVMVLCSRYALPSGDDLAENGVQSVVSSAVSLEELELSLYSLADGRPEPLLQQYLRAVRSLTIQPEREILNAREREILQLVASDLTDNQIAERLGISVRTVNNHLRHTYAKLRVSGRAGAVAAAMMRSLIRPQQA